MKNLLRSVCLIVPLLLFITAPVRGQTAPTQTTLSAAVTSTATTIPLTSTTGITASARVGGDTWIFVDYELMKVNTVVTGAVTVTRGVQGTTYRSHKSGAPVVFGAASNQMWKDVDPDFNAACTRGTGQAAANWINYRTGTVWRCTLGGVWRGMDSMPIDFATTPVFTG